MAYCQCRLRKVFGSVFTTFNWTDITLIRSRDDVHASVLGETLDVGLKRQNIHPNVINYYKHDDIERTLRAASEVSRSKIESKPIWITFYHLLKTTARVAFSDKLVLIFTKSTQINDRINDFTGQGIPFWTGNGNWSPIRDSGFG